MAERPDRNKLATVGKKIDEIRRSYEDSFRDAGNAYERACVLACSLIDLRQAVKDYLPVLRQLQGSRLGFRTDKDKEQQGYSEAVIVDVAIEAVMRGARWTGNEFNIIAGGCYLTKEYWWRAVTELPTITDLVLEPGVPVLDKGRTVVEFSASWKQEGRFYRWIRTIPIIVRSSQSDDATLGKAEARMLRAIYRRITGTEMTDAGDDPEPETKAVKAPEPSPVADKPAPTEAEMGDWDKRDAQEEADRLAAMR